MWNQKDPDRSRCGLHEYITKYHKGKSIRPVSYCPADMNVTLDLE